MKRFWLSVAHIAVMGAGAAGAILFPAGAPLIVAGTGLVNGLIPSPLSPTTPSPTKDKAP
jgi:hypothetical protein